MKLQISLIVIVFSTFCYSQDDHANDATVQLQIVNQSDNFITVIIKNKQIENGLKPVRTVRLSPMDTTIFPFLIVLAENRVPQSDYDMSLYEAPDYYNVNYHGNWNCHRVREGEEFYICEHTINKGVILIDSLVFDSLSFYTELRDNSPVYEASYLDSVPKPLIGIPDMIIGARNVLKAKDPKSNVTIYLNVLVELDGSVSEVEILKSSHNEYNELLKEYFYELKFLPAYKSRLKVRSKFSIPVKYTVF